jgi:hypothetical protein
MSGKALAALKGRAKGALAKEGGELVRLGYDVLVKFMVDELLDRELVQREESMARHAVLQEELCLQADVLPFPARE